MARILLISSGIPSPLNAVVALGVRLRGAGHSVCVAAPDPARELAERNELEFMTIPPPRVNAFAPLISRPKFLERLSPGAKRKRVDLAIRAFGVDRLPSLLAAHAPDLVIVDAELHAHAMVSHCEGFRVALCSSMYTLPPSAERPPLHYAIIPGQGPWSGPFAVRIAWFWYWLWRAFMIWKKSVLYRGGDYATAVTRFARRIGLDLAAFRDRNAWQMPWSLAFPTLVLLPSVLDFAPRSHPRHRYLGPLILDRRAVPAFDEETVALYCGDRGQDGRTRRIAMVFGTILTPSQDFLNRVWQAMAQRPDWTMLCVVGKGWTGEATVPENVLLVDWAPQMEVLAASDAVVFPGGSASIVEAVATETPMLVYPQTIDQFGNAARVAFHGLGMVGSDKDTSDRILARLDALLGDVDLRERLHMVRMAQDREKDDRVVELVAAELLESVQT